MDTINVYAGRPGAGKTIWARNEIMHLLTDPNNIVFYIGFRREIESIDSGIQNAAGEMHFADDATASQAIDCAISLANAAAQNGSSNMSEEEQATRKQIYIFYDQCRYMIDPFIREKLLAAVKAGAQVNILCQYYHQVDTNDKAWLIDNCTCFVISKTRAPRLADEKDLLTAYC